MGVSLIRLSSIKAALNYLICFAFLSIYSASTGYADARNDAQALCQQKLGPGGVAKDDSGFGEERYICVCRPAYEWNGDATGCRKPQSGASSPTRPPQRPPTASGNDWQSPPDDSPESVDGPPPEPKDTAQPRQPNARDKIRRANRRAERIKRAKQRARSKKKNRRVTGSASKARSYCRRRYGSRLVQVRVKRTKFYCHYYGKKAVGYNKRVKWKKFKFRNIR